MELRCKIKENLLPLGIALIIIGFFAILISLSSEKANVKYSFFGLIGPIPFGFGNDKKLFVFTVVMALLILVFFLFYQKYLFR